MTNQELFEGAKKTIINPAGTINYIRKTGAEQHMTTTSEVIDYLVEQYNLSKEPALKHNGRPSDFALYLNLIVNY